jgi:hypothetical protein
LFALPIPDTKDANTPDPAARWNYALDALGDKLGDDMTVEHGPMPGRWDWPLESPLKLRASAVVCDWSVSPKESRLPPKPIAKRDQPQRITLIPYGCTKFRISMFPVTQRTLQLAEPGKPVSPSGK